MNVNLIVPELDRKLVPETARFFFTFLGLFLSRTLTSNSGCLFSPQDVSNH